MTSEGGAPAFYVVPGEACAEVINSERLGFFQAIRDAYRLHGGGQSINPDSYFLTFPDKPPARIIALPAYLGGSVDTAGIKWVASFPQNRERNLHRASAIIVLNNYETGYPMALLEASIVSAQRTGAIAALGAEMLTSWTRRGELAVVGTGLIARAVVDWLLFRGWQFSSTSLYDTDRSAASRFKDWMSPRSKTPIRIAENAISATSPADIVVLATTATAPHLLHPKAFQKSPTILHLSLRDLGLEALLTGQNIVDDVDHCLKAKTSLHLAEEELGHRDFVSGTLNDIIDRRVEPDQTRPRIFSPFGLGVLDVAAGHFILTRTIKSGKAMPIPNFFCEEAHR